MESNDHHAHQPLRRTLRSSARKPPTTTPSSSQQANHLAPPSSSTTGPTTTREDESSTVADGHSPQLSSSGGTTYESSVPTPATSILPPTAPEASSKGRAPPSDGADPSADDDEDQELGAEPSKKETVVGRSAAVASPKRSVAHLISQAALITGRKRLRSAGRRSNAELVGEPSSKALGKRRARSPSLTPAPTDPNQEAHPAVTGSSTGDDGEGADRKRRKRDEAARPSYNLRSRPSQTSLAVASTTANVASSKPAAGSSTPHPSKKGVAAVGGRKGKAKADSSPPPIAAEAGPGNTRIMPRERRSRGNAKAAATKERAAFGHPAPGGSSSTGGGADGPMQSGSGEAQEPVKEARPAEEQDETDADGDVRMEVASPVDVGGIGVLPSADDGNPAPGVFEETTDQESDEDRDEEEDGEGRSGSESGSHSESEGGEDDNEADDYAYGDDDAPRRHELGGPDGDDDHPSDDGVAAAARAFGVGGAIPSTGSRSDALAAMGAMNALGSLGFAGLSGLSGIMSGLTSRLRSILASLRAKGTPQASTDRLVALQELAEILAVSTEDTLAGFFQTEDFSKELISILKGGEGTGAEAGPSKKKKARGADEDEDEDDERDEDEEEADAAMLAAIAASMGEEYGGPGAGAVNDRDVEHMMLASRCLANLMEALPGSSHTVVSHGAVPVLCAKLLEIQFIDLAEQCLSTLEKISEEMPSSIVREGGLTAILQYLDFFSTNVQRTAVTAAANCCRGISSDSFAQLKDPFATLRNVVSYPDQRVSEQAVLAITRVMDSYRHHTDKLEALVTADVLGALMALLSPTGGSKISDSIFTAILKSFTNVAKGSPEMAASLLDAGLADAAYGILVGQLPPETKDDEALAKELTENTPVITQALMRRDRAHVQQTLDLIVEVLPPLPKDGVFDAKLGKKKKSSDAFRVKREEATPALPGGSIDPPASTSGGAASEEAEQLRVKKEGTLDETPSRSASAASVAIAAMRTTKETATARRVELLNLHSRDATARRFHALLLPTLLDVYGASVSSVLRQKALNAMLKIAYFSQPEHLANVLRPVPLASFLASILANRDQPVLVVAALQMSDLLLRKLPEDYHFFFRREGVLHEIERMASEALFSGPATTEEGSSVGPPGSGTSVASTSAVGAEAAGHDALIRRAQHVRDQHASKETKASKKARQLLLDAKQLAVALKEAKTEKAARTVLERLAKGFVTPEYPITSFELAESGLVAALLAFATEQGARAPGLETRKSLLSDVFISGSDGLGGDAAFVPLVKRLQESLSRLEDFDVRTASGSGSDDARKSSASLLSRQVRFRITAMEPSDIPASCRDIVISIHAIAKLDTIDKYVRPRIIKARDDEKKASPASGSRPGVASGSGAPPSPSPAGGNAAPLTTGSTSAPEAGPSTPGGPALAPRRSSRLSGRKPTAEDLLDAQSPTAGGASTIRDAAADDAMDIDTPEISASGFAAAVEEEAGGPAADDALVNVQPTGDGTRMEASTPHGTRIATPQGSRPASAMGMGGSALSALLARSGASSSASRMSYAGAVKAAPKDWHLEYYISGQRLSLESTVYGALVSCDPTVASGARSPWHALHSLSFKRVAGPGPASDAAPAAEVKTAPVPCVTDGSQQSSILRLLRSVHNLHLDWREFKQVAGSPASPTHADQVDETLFINNKLTAKLNRQLEEPMIVASECLPAWATELPMEFHFLFPFETRFAFLQSTSFGYPRLIQKWLNQVRAGNGGGGNSSRGDDHSHYLVRLPRQKVRVSRSKVLESLEKILGMYAKSQALLEIEYFDEVGTGLGPTLEFFSLASTAFMEKQLNMWRDHATDSPSAYVFSLAGLFPAPLSDEAAATASGQRRLKMFGLLGQFVAKALMDSRIVDISLSRIFARLVLGYEVPLTIRSVRAIDRSLASSLEHLQAYVDAKAAILAEGGGRDELKRKLNEVKVDCATLDELALDFVLPGYDVELRPGSAGEPVTMDNVEEYVRLVIEWSLVKGVAQQIDAFKRGFSTIFPVKDLQSFTPEEVVNILGNTENEDWAEDTITASIRPDHGFNVDSQAVRDLVSIMSTFAASDRRTFLQFITGAPKLPVGGFRGLHPPLTVVRKAPESGRPADEQLPSVMTCVNYLKLPVYSSRKVAEAKIRTAMVEGADSFHLS